MKICCQKLPAAGAVNFRFKGRGRGFFFFGRAPAAFDSDRGRCAVEEGMATIHEIFDDMSLNVSAFLQVESIPFPSREFSWKQ